MKNLMFLSFALFAACFSIAQLPPVYKSDNITAISFTAERLGDTYDKSKFASYYSDFSPGDIIIAYISDDEQNKIVGQATWSGDSPLGLVAFMNEANPAAPSLKTGFAFNQTIHLAILKDGDVFKVFPKTLLNTADLKVSQIIGSPMALFKVFDASVGDQLDNLSAIDYNAWLYSQCPRSGAPSIALPTTPASRSDISLMPFKPAFTSDVSYNLITGSGEIFKKNFSWYYRFGEADLSRGYVNIVVQSKGYPGCPGFRLFSHQITFLKLQPSNFDNLTNARFRKMVLNLNASINDDGNLVLVSDGSFPDVNIYVNSMKTGVAPKISFNHNFSGANGLNAVVPLQQGWQSDQKASWTAYIQQISTGHSYFFRSKDFK